LRLEPRLCIFTTSQINDFATLQINDFTNNDFTSLFLYGSADNKIRRRYGLSRRPYLFSTSLVPFPYTPGTLAVPSTCLGYIDLSVFVNQTLSLVGMSLPLWVSRRHVLKTDRRCCPICCAASSD